MAGYFTTGILYVYTVFIVSLASITSASLSLEELNLKVQQLEQNDAAKDVRLQQLEVKVQHLEIKLIKQEMEFQTLIHAAHQSAAGKGNTDLIEKQANNNQLRSAIFRTCRELHQADPSLTSGMYWIDPDGQGVGDDPIYVQCDMATGKTSVLHDNEEPTDVGHCADPGCYSKLINYSASSRQMDALAELSSECHQSIRYDCNLATFETNGIAQSWWNDRNGGAQYFWSGSNNITHTCQCGIDQNCIESYYMCNCDSSVPIPLNDSGVITDKSYLPITRLNFGRTQLATSTGIHTLGRFECSGQVSVSGMPTSCFDLWKIGHSLSGIFLVVGSDYIETVYCDFTKLHHEQGYQTFIGFADVQSSPIYFYAQKETPHNQTGRIPFELMRLNIGGAMDASSGIFTASRNGIYSFAFTGLGRYSATNSLGLLRVAIILNGIEIGNSVAITNDVNESRYTLSLHSILELKAGDQVWINIQHMFSGSRLYEDELHYTHFTGYLLQENVANSLKLVT